MMKGNSCIWILFVLTWFRGPVGAAQDKSAVESSWSYQDELQDPTNPFEDEQELSITNAAFVTESSADGKSQSDRLASSPPKKASPSSDAAVPTHVTTRALDKVTHNAAKADVVGSTHSAASQDSSPTVRLRAGDVLFMKRVVNTFLGHLTQKSESGRYLASLTLDEEKLKVMSKFSESDENYIQEASEAIASCIDYIEPTHSAPSYLESWLSKHQTTIVSLLQILLIVILTLFLLLITMRLWQWMKWKQFLCFMFTLSFVVSVPWTWGHLYKQKLAERIQRADQSFAAPPQCDARRLPWTSFFFPSVERKLCDKFYQDQIVDPLWEIKPTMAIAYTFVEFVWKPLEIMGEPLGIFVTDLLEPLPLLMKPVVLVLGLMFVWWCVVLLSGMRVWTWFFTVEPAVVAQHQLTAMQETVDKMQSFIEDAADENAQRNTQLKDALSRIEERAALEENISEILPVMYEMCADYGQQRNTRSAIIIPCEKTDVSCQTSGPADSHGLVPCAGMDSERRYGAGDSGFSTSTRADKCLDLSHLDHLVLTTSDPQRTVEFYSKIGMRSEIFGNGRQALHFGQSKINIHKTGEEVKPHARYPCAGALDLCLTCNCDIETTLSQLKTQKIDVELGPIARTGARGAITSVYVRDPDENLIELAHYRNDNVPDQQIETVTTISHEAIFPL